MLKSVTIKRIIEFLGENLKCVYGSIDEVMVSYLRDVESVDEFTLDWINSSRSRKQRLAESSISKVIVTDSEVIFSETLKRQGKVILIVDNPKLTVAKIGNEFFIEKFQSRIHPSSVIDPEAKIGQNVFIGPNVSIGKCIIGNNVVILSNVVILDAVIIKDGVIVNAGAILGIDGLGCERERDGSLVKFPHFGRLIISENVEIGAGCNIAKGALSNTIIGYGTKINAGCYIAHNAVIGKNAWISAHVNIAGSVRVEDNVTIYINASIKEQCFIGKNSVIGMGAVVIKNVPEGETWVGIPLENLKSEMEKIIKEVSIFKKETLLNAMHQMDKVNRKLLIVINDDCTFFSLVSIGDIQRAIIRNLPLGTPIEQVVRQDVTYANIEDDLEQVKVTMKTRRNDFMPIIEGDRKIVKIIFWEDLFGEKRIAPQLNLPVIIMAGGKGSRMRPLSNIIPKPLIPINEKTIIEDIMDRFLEFGCNQFYLSVNYKADMVRYYFNSLKNSDYHIRYFQEEIPLGTAGSLSLLKGQIDRTFFVTNCDVLIDQDYSEILNYHKTNRNDITIVAALKHIHIPYGIIETGENGEMGMLIEKPELTLKINSGMYILEPSILKEVPNEEFLHITTLIDRIKSNHGKVGVFPVSEKSWKDIGTWEEYLKSMVK